MGCDHKIKTKMVCEDIMHKRTLRGDKIHNPLSHFGHSVEENNTS